MRGWLLDTNVTAELALPRPAPRVERWARTLGARAYISVLTLGEYERGIANLRPSDLARLRHIQGLLAVRQSFAGRILPVDEAVARRWGMLCGEHRRRAGGFPPPIDALLAAQAIEAGLTLATRNTRDVAGLGVAVFNPWTDDPADFPLATR